MGGEKDMIYVYRPNGTFESDGNINYAPFCAELNATTFNATTNPQQFLSNGDVGNIYISNVSECDSTISFDVKICSSTETIFNQANYLPRYANARKIETIGNVVLTNDSAIFEASDSIVLRSGFKVIRGAYFQAIVKPCE